MTANSISQHSKEFFELVRAIGESKSKQVSASQRAWQMAMQLERKIPSPSIL